EERAGGLLVRGPGARAQDGLGRRAQPPGEGQPRQDARQRPRAVLPQRRARQGRGGPRRGLARCVPGPHWPRVAGGGPAARARAAPAGAPGGAEGMPPAGRHAAAAAAPPFRVARGGGRAQGGARPRRPRACRALREGGGRSPFLLLPPPSLTSPSPPPHAAGMCLLPRRWEGPLPLGGLGLARAPERSAPASPSWRWDWALRCDGAHP
ncbi:unnamed protein product, partial [Prorocentrum cordatum]